MYPGIKREDLSEEQKQTISALSTLAAGLAGGLAGNSTADVVAGAQAGKNAVENNYLSNKQRSECDKEFDACKGNLSCQLAVGTKRDGISVGQDVAYGTGMLAGVPLGLYESVDSLSKAITNPVDTLGAIKQLLTSDDMFSTVSDTVKQSYIDRINLMESEYQRAGAGGAYNAGVEAGKLMSDLLTTVTGGVGVTKAGAALTERVIAKIASRAEKTMPDIPPPAWKAGEGEFSSKPDKTVTNVEYPASKYDGNSLPYKDKVESVTASVDTDIVKTGTVFDSIKATQPAIPGTSIPESFELNVNGQTVWVNPNATKHMGEYLTRNGLSHSTTDGSQAMLTSLQSAVKNASSQGLKFNEKMQIGRWELIFSQRPTDPYPVLKHALYK